jgi:hypothetical protein
MRNLLGPRAGPLGRKRKKRIDLDDSGLQTKIAHPPENGYKALVRFRRPARIFKKRGRFPLSMVPTMGKEAPPCF